MSLNFYADEALTLKISGSSPKRFLFPNKGKKKVSQLWIGDPYFSTVTEEAHSGDTELTLADTSEFLSADDIAAGDSGVATAMSGDQTFTYTGKSQSQLTGVVGITDDILVGDRVQPKVSYKGVGGSNIEVFPAGTDSLNFAIRIQVGATSVLNFPGLPAIFTPTEIPIGVENAIKVFVGVTVPAGVDQEFTHMSLQVNNLFKRDDSDTTAFSTSEATYAPEGALYAYRHDESLPILIRVLPLNRQVADDNPGFIVGEYRWRGDADRNATALVPTRWDIDPNTVGLEKFIAGYGDEDDLEPVDLEEVQDSVFARVHRGAYFTGANRYYLPAGWNLEFLQSSLASANEDGTVTLTLQNVPREQAPIFVGTYVLDNQGYYEKGLEYTYVATLKNPDGSNRTDLPERYYTVDRKNKRITLNISMGHPIMFLGLVSGQDLDYYDLPVYPVDNIDTIYVDRGSDVQALYATAWTFDREQGTVQLPNIPQSLANQPVFAIASPAVAILYDSGTDEDRLITQIDFNPAFSGLAGGFFYLQHRRQKPSSLVLSCDKPRIPIPATQASIIGLVAFGPVYFENDFALLSVTAFGPVTGETIPNAKLDVVVDSDTFSGTINYKNPLTETVSVITGGDGTANLIFIPAGGFGVWIPTIDATGGLGGVATTTVDNDTLVLPAGVPLSQIWNPQEGWLVTTYTVLDNDPLFGKVGGDPAFGEIVWQETGTPGDTDYKTNGERKAWRTGNTSFGDLVIPIDALDVTGHSYTSSDFDGNVRQLVYATAVPQNDSINTNIGAYFVTFVQRVLIKMKLENSNLFSNSILLQMDVPNLIVENPWLILEDSIQGRLEQFRLGYVRQQSS